MKFLGRKLLMRLANKNKSFNVMCRILFGLILIAYSVQFRAVKVLLFQ
jgi:hypothetical protein